MEYSPVTTLLAVLAANAHKTPDQIAAALKSSGWIAFKDMTQEQYNFLVGKYCVVVADNHTDDQHGGFWRVTGRTERWPYPASWNPRTRQGLTEFWFKLYEEYTDGDLPHRSLGRYG
jgi:hypothetical protein